MTVDKYFDLSDINGIIVSIFTLIPFIQAISTYKIVNQIKLIDYGLLSDSEILRFKYFLITIKKNSTKVMVFLFLCGSVSLVSFLFKYHFIYSSQFIFFTFVFSLLSILINIATKSEVINFQSLLNLRLAKKKRKIKRRQLQIEESSIKDKLEK
ncbi:MAG: hypothetical protein L3J83_02135 [Proteobacteria bacterium]|nr:hypothetical protein [Pseudomonadota bacterium]